MTTDPYQTEVAQRADQIIDCVAAQPRHSMWSAHALLARGGGDDTVMEATRQTLGRCVEGGVDADMGGPFHILPAMLLVCRWEDRLSATAVDLVRRFFLEGVLERGNTENHWLMYYTGLLLAAERWADAPELWDGRAPSVTRREATRWILGTIERTARLGHHEYDSPGYHVEHMTPLIGLYEHTRDAHLRTQVGRVLTLLTADMALEFFRGSWAGSHSREGYRENTWTRVGPVRTLQYLYFGGEPFDPAEHVHPYAVPAVVAAWRPPALFAAMAWDRATPHAVRKTKAPRNIIRHADRDAAPVRKYTWMSRSFALGSAQLGLPGTAAGPIDLVSWDLTWHGPKHEAKITCNHPFVGGERFSAFLAPLPHNAARAIGSDKPYLQSTDRLFGASPWERLVQHEGAILVGYRIPAGDAAPFANLYLPKGAAWVEQGGWLMAAFDGFHVGLRPIGDYHWERIRESRNDAIMVSEGDLIDGWLLRLAGPHPALALEAVEADAVASFAAFRQRRAELDVDASGWAAHGRLALRTVAGVDLELNWGGEHRIGGAVVDYGAWPLYGAPGARAEVGTGRLTFAHGGDTVQVDFGLDPQAPLLPMRVIG